MRMNNAISDLDGIKVFIDDILVYGKGNTMTEALADHDRKVDSLFQRLRENNIKLNPDKV